MIRADPHAWRAAIARVDAAGGALAVWGVLYEDRYETRFGDGFYLSLRGVALSESDARRLAALAPPGELTHWHVRRYVLVRADASLRIDAPPAREEEFSVEDIVAQLCEIAEGGGASKLLVGSGAEGRAPGHNLLSLD